MSMEKKKELKYLSNSGSQYVSLDTEQKVIHILLNSFHSCMDINILNKNDFAHYETQALFNQFIELKDKVETTPLFLLTEYIDHANYIWEELLIDSTYYNDYQRLLKKLSLKRQVEEALTKDRDISIYQNELNKLYGKEEAQESVAKVVEDIWKNDGKIRGVSTGFNNLDSSILGFENGRLYTIAARAGLGKTSFAVNCMYQQLAKAQKVAFFSLEMDRTEMYLKLASLKLKKGVKRIKTGDIAQEHKQLCMSFLGALDKLDSLNVFTSVDVRNINDICIRARELKRAGNLDIMYVDHIGLCKDTSRKFQSRNYEIESITNKLKLLSQELEVPVVMVVQINRGVEGRDNKRPGMSDLKDSGAIEQDSDVVMILYRSYYYLSTKKFDDAEKQAKLLELTEQSRNKSEIIVAKNRQGDTSVVDMYINLDCMEYLEAPTQEMIDMEKKASREAYYQKAVTKQ